MRAAVYTGPQRFEVQEVPVPRPDAGEILVRVEYASICGTDVHGFMHDVVPHGSTLGHEYSGTVAALGEGVRHWSVGDPIVGGGGERPSGMPRFVDSDPRLNFREAGFKAMPPSAQAYGEYVVMKGWQPLALPDGVSLLTASMTEPLCKGVRSIHKSHFRIGDSVAVIGAGPIGLFCIQVAVAAGASKVIAVEPAAARAKAATESGADVVLDPREVDVEEVLVKLTDGNGPHVVIETAGARSTLSDSMAAVRKRGSVVLVALSWDPVPVMPVDWIAREVRMVTTISDEPSDWRTGLDLMARGLVTTEPLLAPGAVVPLESIQDTFESLTTPSDQIKMVIRP
jgi:(R,R)-butanediol dehydrogenase/meso-butanediol dehydrogenase/diacetyl reductase